MDARGRNDAAKATRSSPPNYADLGAVGGRPPGSSWGLWGDDDVLGSLNLLTAERIAQAARRVRAGKVFSLNLEVHLPDPPLFKRAPTEHVILPSASGHAFNDQLKFNTQASTQWDGFRHMRHPAHGFYGGLPAEHHGIDHWARHGGIVGRGVLADVGRWREREGRPIEPGRSDPIEPEEVAACLGAQGVNVMPGDILLCAQAGCLGTGRSIPMLALATSRKAIPHAG